MCSLSIIFLALGSRLEQTVASIPRKERHGEHPASANFLHKGQDSQYLNHFWPGIVPITQFFFLNNFLKMFFFLAFKVLYIKIGHGPDLTSMPNSLVELCVQPKYNLSHFNFKFSSIHIEKSQKKVNFNNAFYLTQYILNITISTCNQYKNY